MVNCGPTITYGKSHLKWPRFTRKRAWARFWRHLGPLHKRDWETVTVTLQALSLVEKANPVQVRFTLHLRDQWSMWMKDGCKVYMDPTWHRTDHVSWSLGLFLKPISWRRSNTTPGDRGTSYAHNHWFILLYHVWGSAWIGIHWNSIWLRA